MKRFLIITADDFGLHPAVNAAIEAANRSGVLTAASLMMGALATVDAIRRARTLPSLRVGLHVVLADGKATLPPAVIPALVDESGHMKGRMVPNAVRFFSNAGIRRQLEAEIRAQFEAFAATGLLLDHVNVHKHFHLHPTLLGMLLKIGTDYGMSSIRIPDEPLWAAVRTKRFTPVIGNLFLKPWMSIMRQRVRAAGLQCSDAVFGIAASGAMTEAVLLTVLSRLPTGVTEIYLHPATLQGSRIATSMGRYRHLDEFRALMSHRVRAAIVASQSGCGGYADVPR